MTILLYRNNSQVCHNIFTLILLFRCQPGQLQICQNSHIMRATCCNSPQNIVPDPTAVPVPNLSLYILWQCRGIGSFFSAKRRRKYWAREQTRLRFWLTSLELGGAGEGGRGATCPHGNKAGLAPTLRRQGDAGDL